MMELHRSWIHNEIWIEKDLRFLLALGWIFEGIILIEYRSIVVHQRTVKWFTDI